MSIEIKGWNNEIYRGLFTRPEVQDERWAAQLEQGVQPAEGGEEGRDHRLLLRQPQPGQDTEEFGFNFRKEVF